jgi:hypothetical protein
VALDVHDFGDGPAAVQRWWGGQEEHGVGRMRERALYVHDFGDRRARKPPLAIVLSQTRMFSPPLRGGLDVGEWNEVVVHGRSTTLS